jgi:hypothetical protein
MWASTGRFFLKTNTSLTFVKDFVSLVELDQILRMTYFKKIYVPSRPYLGFHQRIFIKFQIWHLRTPAMNVFIYYHIITSYTACVSLLMQVCIYVCVCVCACIHLLICLTTGPKRAHPTVRSRAFFFKWRYPLLPLRSTSSSSSSYHFYPPYFFP